MLDDLASSPNPYPAYVSLRERGVHQVEDGRWVVARAVDVAAVLGSADVAVGFVPRTDDPSAAVQGRMARFSDGDDHDRRRAIGVHRLATVAPEALRSAAHRLALDHLAAASLHGEGEVDVMAELARVVPVAVLAEALGVADPEAAVDATRQLALALAPPVGGTSLGAVTPASRLVELLGHGSSLTEEAINVVALLFQTMDATAGLVGNAVLAAHRFGGTANNVDLVAETGRFDPPVQLTNRVAVRDVEVGGVVIPAGGRIVVLLAAANRDPDLFDRPGELDPDRDAVSPGLTFGTGTRPCPGVRHGLQLAAGILDALAEVGASVVDRGEPVDYERRANLRIPARIFVRVSGGGGPTVAP